MKLKNIYKYSEEGRKNKNKTQNKKKKMAELKS